MGTIYGNKPISANGLVLCLDAASPKSYPGSGNTWYDISGQGRNATLYNSPTFSGGVMNLVAASSQYAAVPYNSDWKTLPYFTAEVIYMFPASTGAYVLCFDRSGGAGWNITGPGPAVYVAYGTNGAPYYTYSNYASFANLWQHDVMTIDNVAGNVNIYKNGTPYTNGTFTPGGTIGSVSTPLGIGARVSSLGAADSYSTCSIALVRFYNRVLTADEAAQNFNVTRGRFGI